MQTTPMIIGGEKVTTQETIGVINPATGKVFAEVPSANESHVAAAVAAARNAFPEWSAQSHADRAALLMAIADAMESQQEALAALVTQETGKPMMGFEGIGSFMEVGGAIAWLRYTTSLTLPVEVVQDDDTAKVEVHHKPVGVIGSITPWNWPLMIAVWHYAPALLAGNTVVAKPSEFTPLATLRLAEIANEILPAGVLNVVSGDGAVGAHITQSEGVNKIAFTGSSATGKAIARTAATDLKRLTLELGGNDAGIVLSDVDPKSVARSLFKVSFHNNGQTCQALKRLYVHEAVFDDVCQALTEIANTVVVGDGAKPDTELGPLQNQKQLDIVIDLVNDAKANGATILTGGERSDEPGYFFPPTLVTDISNGARLVDEEQFGPVLPIIKFSTDDEAVALANSSAAGLGGSVWSQDIDKATQLAARLESGSVWVNTHADIQPNAPMGGHKQSGIGCMFGRWGLTENTDIQTLKILKT